ncbi:MAG: hypothetical protein Q9222_006676 [Ikaeria aurantiellina]
MGYDRRDQIIEDSLNNRVVKFSNQTAWRLTKKISEKPWEGTSPEEREEGQEGDDEWQPSEAHAVYECTQVYGPRLGTVAIMKIRIEVPYSLPPNDNAQDRAKESSGMRLNDWTVQEIETLKRLTTAECSSAPRLLGVQVDVQDQSVLYFPASDQRQSDVRWWMPGGYIVYILMTKLSAEPLDICSYWEEHRFAREDRDEIRTAFRKAYLWVQNSDSQPWCLRAGREVRRLGVLHFDARLENLMWDRSSKKW